MIEVILTDLPWEEKTQEERDWHNETEEVFCNYYAEQFWNDAKKLNL